MYFINYLYKRFFNRNRNLNKGFKCILFTYIVYVCVFYTSCLYILLH